jgi:hypothetical protein
MSLQIPKFRASSLGEIMTDPKKKGDVLSVGAVTAVTQLAKEFVYGYDYQVSGKYMEKGLQVEDRSIALLNEVLFTNYTKNTERKTNEWVTGECDIFTGSKIHDIKSAWSLQTFPVVAFQGEDKTYEWQGRAYMMLWDVDEFEIDYCLVNTPDHLIGYEDPSLHIVEHIAPELRVTRVIYKRDKELEDKIVTKVTAAQKLYVELIEQIGNEHKF